ncbi:zinc ribbon domain-containing protein [Corynebacterium cystitidis]|uniref:zinc ribbon domain-containing protein n=1 Tax=Corynebacterium cystitidis TaxID=35757 RepID=UPI00211DE981|nr:zinc ribbon domain-containing protein [Corynebacterium cystitidis]
MTGNHEPIIEPAVWEQVQHEIARRAQEQSGTASSFTARLKCGTCGGWYGSTTWHADTKYESRIWRCNHKYDNPAIRCDTPHVTSSQIEQAFTQALATLLVLPSPDVLDETINHDCGISREQRDLAAIRATLQSLVAQMETMIAANANVTLDQDHYNAEFTRLQTQYDRDATRIDALQVAIDTKENLACNITDVWEYRRAPIRTWPIVKTSGVASSNTPLSTQTGLSPSRHHLHRLTLRTHTCYTQR